MPLLWERVIGYVLGPAAEQWQATADGVMIERCALGAAPESKPCNGPHIVPSTYTDRLTHTTWAGDVILVSEEDPQRLQAMSADVSNAVAKKGWRIATGKHRFWSSAHPTKTRAQGTTLGAQDELQVLGLSVATGGTLELDHRIDRAWAACPEQCGSHTPRALVARVKWLKWMHHLALVLSGGSWGWLWDSSFVSRINHIVAKLVRISCWG